MDVLTWNKEEKSEMQTTSFLCDIKKKQWWFKRKNNSISFTFYVLSRFKYYLLLVRNSIANRNFPGWRAGAGEGHSLKRLLPWEENLEGCCLSNLYQAQQVIRCLCCKSAMFLQPYVVTMVGTGSKRLNGGRGEAQRCVFSSQCAEGLWAL